MVQKYTNGFQYPNCRPDLTMYLKQLNLSNFKNYSMAQFAFGPTTNCLLGPNGAGKTNVLDAIYYLSFTKSALHTTDFHSLKHNTSQFVIKGDFGGDGTTNEVLCDYSRQAGKRMRINGKAPPRMADHIGNYPSVLIAPTTTELIGGGSKTRRKFFDRLIAQIDKQYLENLITYTNQLRQRNSLLRRFAEQPVDYDLLDAYDEKIALTGSYIHRKRKAFMEKFVPLFSYHYAFLAGENQEEANIVYRSDCEEQDIRLKLKECLPKDLSLQRTSSGIHCDDFVFLLKGYPLKYMGSQGQQKSFLVGLKLAEFQSIEAHKGFKPLLLLDDIFDKLDDERIDKLLTLMVKGVFGQFFVTDARPDRSRSLLGEKKIASTFFQIDGTTQVFPSS